MYSYKGMEDPDNGPTPKSSSSEEDHISTGPFSDEDIWADFDSAIELGHQLRRQDRLKEQSQDCSGQVASLKVGFGGCNSGVGTKGSTRACADEIVSKATDDEKERVCPSVNLNKSTNLKTDQKTEEGVTSLSKYEECRQGYDGKEGADSGISLSQVISNDNIPGQISLDDSQVQNAIATKEKVCAQVPNNVRATHNGTKDQRCSRMTPKDVASASTEKVKVTSQDTGKLKVTYQATGQQGREEVTFNPEEEDPSDSSGDQSDESSDFTDQEKPSGFGITWFWPETEPVTMPLCNVPRMLGLGMDEWLTPTHGSYDISDSSLSDSADDERSVTSSSDKEVSPRITATQRQVVNEEVRRNGLVCLESSKLNGRQNIRRDAPQPSDISKKIVEKGNSRNARNHRSHAEIPNLDGKWQNDTLILDRCTKALARKKHHTTAVVHPIGDSVKEDRKSQDAQSKNNVLSDDTSARSCVTEHNHTGRSLHQRLRQTARRVRDRIQSFGKMCTACCR